ncbi:MAG: biotin--[acetyl-CoA-carboxylase] ligase [Bacteroidota bacterium]
MHFLLLGKISPAQFLNQMASSLFTGKHKITLPEIGSTNDYAFSLLPENPPDGTLVRAITQTAGRGQKGNHWVSAPGQNLTFSLIYYPRFLLAQEVFSLSKVICLGLRDAISTCLPWQEVLIKWPNDLLINQQKIAGILIENLLEGARLKACVAGIGLNVNQTQFDANLSPPPTSMRKFADADLNLEEVLETVFSHVEKYYLMLREGNKAKLDRTYLEHLYAYQEPHVFRAQEKLFTGVIQGVDRYGRLAIMIEQELAYFDIKEVSFVW